jgi:ribosomal protein S27E
MLAEVRAADPEGGGLPRHVERELTEYLRCGVLAHGFARVRCTTCHDEIVVAYHVPNQRRPPRPPHTRPEWADPLHEVQCERHSFATDVLSCPCGGRRSVVAVVVDSALARAVLAALGLPCTPATFAPARAPPQAELWFDDAS